MLKARRQTTEERRNWKRHTGVTYDTTTEALCLTVTVTGTEVNTVVSLCTEGEAWAEEGEGDEVGV